MNKLYVIFTAVLLVTGLFQSGWQVIAQVPEKMSYQAVIRDNNDQLVTNSDIGMQISILQDSSEGTSVYIERHFPTTNQNGLISIVIGDGTVVSGNLETIDWSEGPYFMKIETDLHGGANYTIVGTSQLLSVPYAFFAKTADSILGTIDETDPVFSASIAAGITEADTNNWNSSNTILQTYKDELNQIVDKFLWVLEDSETRGLVKDIEGSLYKTVIIGTQTWMAENLKTTKYNNGTEIPPVTDNKIWYGLSTPAYCWYNNDSVTYSDTYGALYNGYTVDTLNLCPIGWHVPSDEEWTILNDYLGGESIAGGKLKESDTIHWHSPNTGATNEIGFTALPGGTREVGGDFYNIGYTGYWYSSTEGSPESAWGRLMFHNEVRWGRIHDYKRKGYSVRCLKD